MQGGRGASPSAAGVARCFPDPSRPPWLHCLAPSPFPNLLGLGAAHSPSPSAAGGCPLPGLRTGSSTLALRHWGRAASPTLPRVARLVASPPRWKRGGSSAERTGAWGCTREAPAPSAGAKGRAREEGHAAQEEGMQAPVPLPSHSFYKGMGAEWCAHPLPLRGLPFAHYPEGGVSTTPCVVPRAQPLRAPPFGCHLAHAVPHAGQRAHGTRKVGRTGVVHAERHAGSCSRAMGEGRRREAVPPSCYPRVVRSPIEAHGVGQKGEGSGNPAQRVCVAPPHAKGGWGVCDAAPILTAPPLLPYLRTSPGPCPNVGAAFSAPHSRGREGEGRCAHKTGAPFPWGPCFVRALIASEGGGH